MRKKTRAQKLEQGTSIKNFRALVKLWPWLKTSKTYLILAMIMIPASATIESLTPIVVQKTIDLGILKRDQAVIYHWAGIFLVLVFFSYIFRALQAITTATAVHRMILDMRGSLVRHVLRLPSSFHDKQLSGALATRATGDFDNLSESLNQGVLSSLIDVVALVGCIVGMFVLSVKLAFITLILLPLVTWIVVWFSRKLNNAMMSARKKISALNGYTQEAFSAMTAVKLLNATRHVSKRYANLNGDYRDAQMESVFYDAFMFATLDGIASITLGIVLFTVIRTAGIGSDLTAGVIVGFVQYVQLIFEPLKQLGTKMAMLQGAFTSVERIFGLLDRTDHIPGNEHAAWPHAPDVAFKHVYFSYGAESGEVLKDVSFDLPGGSSLAIVGATGSGKSTIVKLICKMYAGHSGTITLNGQDINRFDAMDLRRHMAIVPQDIVLFEASVAFNISLGSPDINAADIKAAAAITGADRFINGLPGQFDYLIREGGGNLSHGQRQLIAFTRALVRQPRILVLDEATSSIDPQSEALIQESISRILKGRTVIIIAHRLNTIKHCDHVLVIEHGKVQENGTIPDLIAKKGRFFELQSHGLSERC